MCCGRQKRFDEAEGSISKRLARQREELGPDDGETLKTASGLAELSSLQGDFEGPRRCSTRSWRPSFGCGARNTRTPCRASRLWPTSATSRGGSTRHSISATERWRPAPGPWAPSTPRCSRQLGRGAAHSRGWIGERKPRAQAGHIIDAYSDTLGEEHPTTIEARRRLGD